MSCSPACRWSCLTLLMLGGCATPGDQVARPEGRDPTYAELVEAQNPRAEMLSTACARGVVEMRWTDEAGAGQFQQGDAVLWIDLPSRTALRISKLGDTLLWIGSDEDRAWFFDLLREPSRVRISPLGERGAAGPIDPIVLITAMGLTPLPEPLAGDAIPEVRWSSDPDGAGWAVDVPVDTSTATIVFDPVQYRPVRIEIRDADGVTRIRSRLKDYRTVPIPGRPLMASPKMAERVEMTSGDGEISLSLREWSGDVTHEPMDRVFDLSGLKGLMRPEIVEE